MSSSQVGRELVKGSFMAAMGSIIWLPTTLFAADLPPAYPGLPTYEEAHSRGVADYLHEWHVVAGAGALISPKYEGSDTFSVMPVPMVSAAFGNWVMVDPRGLTAKLYRTNGFGLSARAGYDLGRKESDSDRLAGLGDLEPGGVLGATIDYHIGPFSAFSSVDQILGGSDGLQAKLGVSATHTYDKFSFEAGVTVTWANDAYMESRFGITPTQSARSGLAVYDASAGLKRVDLSAAVTYNMTDNWLVRGQLGAGYMLGNAADSPIVQDKLQPFGLLTVGYKF